MSRIVVIGVGNAFRGDDAAGREVARRVRERVPGEIDVVVCELEPTRLIDAWDDAESAVVVDAVSSGAEPGTVHRFDASTDTLPSREFRSSTHAFSIADALELGRALGRAPQRVVVLGLEGASFGLGDPLTPAVEAAIPRVVEQALAELGEDAS